MNFIELEKRQAFINKECGFELNQKGLLLGFYAELGELASAIALYKGWKKPKPSDLDKFPNWESDLLKEIADEMADVLVYILQLEINDEIDFDESLADTVLNIGCVEEIDIVKASNTLVKLAKEFEIDLEKAYYTKTEKLLRRFGK
jgi:NTP pyrophosphatase (non-canonical NTP hydrolase)